MKWRENYQRYKERLTDVNWYFVGGLFFLVLVIFGFSLTGWKLTKLVNDAQQVPIDAVVVKGERHYLTDSEIQMALKSLLSRSFFSANVTQVQKALEALPWVYRASVKREWPSKLKVYIQEQQVLAHWNGNQWINQQGDVFQAVVPKHIEMGPLPYLYGPNGEAKDMLKSYQQLKKLLAINGFHVERLTLTPRRAWQVILANGIELHLGREDKMRRVQRFIDVYPILKKENKPIDHVDLRYDTGLAIGWKKRQSENR
ncbi:FtsQ-type POTRA domain-containing protein [Parashewanella curva]|uniref:Cell division protein FtsQ n=1 Tax=Parashewanella curva TaxID=2338552 RepID=A0A3L8PUI4_9GAMM|nr:cell division protein FtsQ/DivIB [Parashewanella curva]RLV58964.1 FtsQ-type POTRA domain-containing protein [Parashewanella curva]